MHEGIIKGENFNKKRIALKYSAIFIYFLLLKWYNINILKKVKEYDVRSDILC